MRAYRKKQLPQASPLSWGLILDTTGTERLHHSEAALAGRLLQSLAKRGFHARLAIAPTVGSAWGISRFADKPLVIAQDSARNLIAPLPIEALRLEPQAIESLHALGLRYVAELLTLETKALPSRFGPSIVTRIEQALGVQNEPLEFIRPKELFSAQRSFEIPLLKEESLRKAILDCFSRIFDQLQKAQKKAASFMLLLTTLDRYGTPHTVRREVSLYHASADPAHIGAVIQPILESIYPGEGVSEIHVSAHATSAHHYRQGEMAAEPEERYGAESQRDAQGEAVNQLMTRLGPQQVKRVLFEESYIPEKSFTYQPVLEQQPTKVHPPIIHDRPSYLLSPPEAVHVIALMPDNPPVQVIWRGKRLQIARGIGPERISAEWWHSNLDRSSAYEGRDYFRVQDQDGRWLWIYRDRTSLQWFVHGIWA